MAEVFAASGGENFKSMAEPSAISEVTVAIDGQYFRTQTKPFPITGPRHFHPSMVTTSEYPHHHDNSNTDDDGNSDTSLDDDGNSNTLQNAPLRNKRNKPQFAESKFGRTQFIEPEGSWSELKYHYGNFDGKSPWANVGSTENGKFEFKEPYVQHNYSAKIQEKLSPLEGIFRAKCLAFDGQITTDANSRVGWPVLWEPQCAFAYPTDFLADHELSETSRYRKIQNVSATEFERDVAIRKFAKSWGSHHHVGDVPSAAEVLQETGVDISKVVVAHPALTKRKSEIASTPARQSDLPTARVKHWLADTGCGYDLVSRRHVARIANNIKASSRPLTFSTANGATEATEDICLKLDELDEDIEPYVLPSTPVVISIGRRCLDQGYDFRRPAGNNPTSSAPLARQLDW